MANKVQIYLPTYSASVQIFREGSIVMNLAGKGFKTDRESSLTPSRSEHKHTAMCFIMTAPITYCRHRASLARGLVALLIRPTLPAMYHITVLVQVLHPACKVSVKLILFKRFSTSILLSISTCYVVGYESALLDLRHVLELKYSCRTHCQNPTPRSYSSRIF